MREEKVNLNSKGAAQMHSFDAFVSFRTPLPSINAKRHGVNELDLHLHEARILEMVSSELKLSVDAMLCNCSYFTFSHISTLPLKDKQI